MIDPSQIRAHMEGVGSDGEHVGTVDKLVMKLTRNDPAAEGERHVIDLDDVASIDDGSVAFATVDESANEDHALPR